MDFFAHREVQATLGISNVGQQVPEFDLVANEVKRQPRAATRPPTTAVSRVDLRLGEGEVREVRRGQERSGEVRRGQGRSREVRTGHEMSEQVRRGQERSGELRRAELL